MPFGPTNAPPFYTVTMKYFKTEWDKLFIISVLALVTLNSEMIELQGFDVILISPKPLVWGSRTIIDNILLWCDIQKSLLLYFYCVFEVFKNTGFHSA